LRKIHLLRGLNESGVLCGIELPRYATDNLSEVSCKSCIRIYNKDEPIKVEYKGEPIQEPMTPTHKRIVKLTNGGKVPFLSNFLGFERHYAVYEVYEYNKEGE